MSSIYLSKMLVFLCVILLGLSCVTYIIYYLLQSNIVVKTDTVKEKLESKEKLSIDFKAGQTIRVKMTKQNNEVIAMDINDYLRGVLASEMPAYYNLEALKAQAIVARTYTYRKMNEHAEGKEADICDNFNHCQAFYTKEQLMNIWTRRGDDEKTRDEYWENINKAVVQTQNKVITYNGEFIKAFFHASSPIKTENVDQIWGKSYYPYLISVDNVESNEYKNRTSEVIVTFKDMEKYIKDNIKKDFNLKYDNNINIYSNTSSGRVKEINVCGIKISAEKLRIAFGLKSTQFCMNIVDNTSIKFEVTGYGHGIGLSQVGSDYLANKGMKAEDIIKYYYKGVEVLKLDI